MAKKSQWASIGKRKVELSNLDKVLFPEDGIVKAEVIEYYLKIAPTLLNHVKGRALTLIRFPDGIHGESFYQKSRPDWAPDWLEFVRLGSEEKKDYIVATEPASLVWLANLASLELHQLHSRKPNYDFPDYMVFDLDPPEGYDFRKIIPIAFELKAIIENFGYTPFVKTTGGKGIHMCCPIQPKWDFHTVFEAAQLIAKIFVDKFPNETTLHIKKEARKGRVLIDIYRIRTGQSIVSPYSIRGRIGAPVSMPLTWDELSQVQDPHVFNIRTALDKVIADGDAWEGIDAFASDIHTHRVAAAVKELPFNKKHKTPEQLEKYSKKRDFDKTPEPDARIAEAGGNSFVVHRHHATNLHYDLRLEQDGVLKSWAVPRGLPPRPGIKRLAVQTEDHPMKYLTFDGSIPKGQYGGGEMWIYALGKYQITKEKKDGFYFRLNSKELTGEYRIHKIKEKEWLLERVDVPQTDYLTMPVEPMLSESADKPPVGDDFIYEIKWDGIRALIALEDGHVKIHTRNQKDITLQFPELLFGEKAFRANCALFDAEIVCLDAHGKPEFRKVINRMSSNGDAVIKSMAKSHPVHCYIFDCLYLDGRSLINDPLIRRKEWIKDVLKKDTAYRVSEFVDDGNLLFEASREHNLEGIMAKRRQSKYLPGRRSDVWLKIKVRQTAECVVIGYTQGKGNRESFFGALHIADRVGDQLEYRGKVGTGIDDQSMSEISAQLKTYSKIKKPVKNKVLDEKVSIWIEPRMIVEISYSRLTPDHMYREPVLLRLRPDLSI